MKKLKRPLEPAFAIAWVICGILAVVLQNRVFFKIGSVFFIAVIAVYFYYNAKEKKQLKQDALNQNKATDQN